MVSSHRFQVDATPPQKQTTGGSRTDVTQQELAVLKGISLSLLRLHPKGIREPHWHPNANELSYCLEGRALMTVFSPGAVHDTFVIEPGALAFVPMGSIHHIENIGEEPVKLLICFDHEMPEDLNLSSSVAVMPSEILGETFRQKPDFF
ncbi:Cupin 1 family protein [Candidatus Protochlamydia naegleriophila]|uniref:Cupin 1 family protein n=1 Tax=Candidatus Protochlamydia naegleriophila TaxID=389348 RepID=A0A0U5EU44_9BACT|nr:cupin domain-containing protein [Candidatus Protochlamydia naegleriophila]CUI17776.1 Cupin 1 family protein [Candidatus Protochlamydia naegleriophila]